MSDFAPIFKGWNVWGVWQAKDLDFDLLMIGVSRDRRLQIWVEDAIRLGAAGASVADPLDLKGSQIQILPGAPEGLQVRARKEDVAGPAMILNGPGELRYVRFFNRGNVSQLVWPRSTNYLLEKVYTPSDKAPATQGPAPTTISDTVSEGGSEVVKSVVGTSGVLLLGAGTLTLAYVLWKLKR